MNYLAMTSTSSMHAAHAAQRDRALPAHAPRPQDVLPDAPRAKNAARIGARERQHHEPPYTHRGHKNAARGKRRPRTSHTHYRHTTGALRRPAREKRTARAQLNLNATARPRSKDSSSTATCRSRPLPPFWPEGVSRPCQLRLCYRRWRLDWARARRVP